MTTTSTSAAHAGDRATSSGNSAVARLAEVVIGLFERIPNTLIAFIARFSIAAVFWNSGQTKIQGFVANLVTGEFTLGWPSLSDSALALFQDLDSDGRMGRNVLGIPTEPWGASGSPGPAAAVLRVRDRKPANPVRSVRASSSRPTATS